MIFGIGSGREVRTQRAPNPKAWHSCSFALGPFRHPNYPPTPQLLQRSFTPLAAVFLYTGIQPEGLIAEPDSQIPDLNVQGVGLSGFAYVKAFRPRISWGHGLGFGVLCSGLRIEGSFNTHDARFTLRSLPLAACTTTATLNDPQPQTLCPKTSSECGSPCPYTPQTSSS